MDKIDEQLNNLLSKELPSEIHELVMQKVKFRKIRPVLFTVFAVLVFSFITSAWYINVKLIDAEFMDMAQDFLDVFSFNFSFISIMLANFLEIISPLLFSYTVLSFIGVLYIVKQINFYKFSRA